MVDNAISMHSSIAASGNLVTNLKIAREVGFDCLELTLPVLYPYLDAGHSLDELAEVVGDFPVAGCGWLMQIERRGPYREALLEDAHRIFSVAKAVHAVGVQCLTGPADVNATRAYLAGEPFDGYMGTLGLPAEEQFEVAKENMAELADIAADYGLLLYLECLSWTPVNKISQAYEIARTCGRDNVRVVVDTFHAYVAQESPEEIAKMDPKYIYGVHVSDCLPFDRSQPADENVIRACAFGEGDVDLQAYCDAVIATGYKGFWDTEIFSPRQIQEDPLELAKEMHAALTKFSRR